MLEGGAPVGCDDSKREEADSQAVSGTALRDDSVWMDGVTIVVAGVSFSMSEKTAVEVGPFNDEMTTADLGRDRERVLSHLRKRAYGLLMNFISQSGLGYQSDLPRLKELCEEHFERESGSTTGSIRERVTIDVTVPNPPLKKMDRLVRDWFDELPVDAVGISLSIPLEKEAMRNLRRKAFRRVQDKYLIRSYDEANGVMVELEDDFFLSLTVTDELLKMRLSTKYDFQLADRVKEFPVLEFLCELLGRGWAGGLAEE